MMVDKKLKKQIKKFKKYPNAAMRDLRLSPATRVLIFSAKFQDRENWEELILEELNMTTLEFQLALMSMLDD